MVDPNEMDALGFGPQVGSPVFHLPDGRRLAISVADVQIFQCLSAMAYEENMGMYLWKLVGQPYKLWQAITPEPGIVPDQILSNIVATAGGPAMFILDAMNHCAKELVRYLQFNPQWPVNQNLVNEVVNAMSSWELKPVLANSPATVVLPRFKLS